jgi:hypothetical protein
MSYTTGGQTIDKSMNGIISFNGESVTADNITCETLEVNTSATFDGTATFNSTLPTSVITTTTNDNQFITRGIGNALYTGSGLLSSNNVWLGTNAFNTSVPTSILTGTPTSTQIAPVAMLDNIYGRLTTAFTNTWLSTNLFNAILPTSTITGTPTATQIAPVAMLNNLYVAIVTGGYARLTSVANAFTNNNSFDSFLPTSTITGTPTATQIAPVAMLNNLYVAIVTGGYARLTSVANAFTNNNSFDSFLPTSSLTGTPTGTQIAPVAMLNNLYVAIVTGGYARLTSVANAFTNNNSFDSFLPTSILTTSSSVNELINRTIANLYYGQITTGVSNTWLSTNNFQNSTASASLNVTQNESVPTFSPLLKLTNLQTPQSIIFFLLNAIAGSANTCVQAGDAVMYSNPTPLVLTIAQTGGTGVRITSSDVVLSSSSQVGVKNGITTTTSTPAFYIGNSETSISYLSFLLNAFATSVNPNVATGDDVIYSNGGILNLCTSSATAVGIRISATDIQTRATTTTLTGTTLNNDIVTTNLGGTTTNVSSNNLAISTSTATTFVNLPSTTTTFTSAGTNDFITKNIGDALYADEVTGGYARLSTISNSFTNSNTFTGTSNNFNTGVANQSANIGLIIRNNNNTGLINFVPCSTTSSFNPIVGFGDSVIASATNVANNSGLVLTANSTTRVGVRIISSGASGFVSIYAQETEVIGSATGATNIENFTITNSETTPSSVKFLLNVSSSGYPNSMSIINDNTIYGSIGKRLVLTTVSATACGIGIDATTVRVRGTDLNLTMTGTTTIAGTNCNINATSATVLTNGQTARDSGLQFTVKNSMATVRAISYGLCLNAGNYNGIVADNDTAIIAGGSVGTSTLVLCCHSNTAGGIKISPTGTNTIYGSTTFTNPIRFNYSATPTFVDYEIGYNLEPTGTTIYAPTANQLYQGNSFTLTRGVWIVKSYCGIYSSINQARVYMSLSTSNLSHDVGNRTYAYSNAGGITVNGFQVNKVFVVPTAGTTLYVMLSSNLATGINPTYFVSYQATRIA